jgi:hypothetical protein
MALPQAGLWQCQRLFRGGGYIGVGLDPTVAQEVWVWNDTDKCPLKKVETGPERAWGGVAIVGSHLQQTGQER